MVCVLFVCVWGTFSSMMACSAIGRGGCEVYIGAESLKNSINASVNVVDTHKENGRLGPVSKRKIVDDAIHRHACDERCQTNDKVIMFQV